jgi:hypothetical protein
MMWIISSIAAAYAVAALAVLLALAARRSSCWRSEAGFWAVTCLVCLAFIAGIVPWFWQIPFVAKVQFPWRLMIVVEFAAITMLCLMPWPVPSRLASYILVLAIVVLVPGLTLMVMGIKIRAEASSTITEAPAELKQFLPACYPQKPDGGYAELSLGPVENLPTVACAPAPRLCRAIDQPLGELAVEIDAQEPTVVTLRRFAYPYWRLDPALPLTATEPLQLVSFTVPAGRHSVRLRHEAVPAERLGWAVAAGSLVLLLAWAFFDRQRDVGRSARQTAG